ncbi:uncharacterized protein LOC130675081 [Microplitis mediator]|uniref:uncharacterized protein LOC130675081 n=1 Tax=Microplitis mediator TaxID=375433 RepID=UPI002553F30A|nr:uncharacterized protein LOC130675081 [Microplitis mediator]XP_057336549.1 uncharacterized protein LOC130675081 [Microplitis mediator]
MNRYQPTDWTRADAARGQAGHLRRNQAGRYRDSSGRAPLRRSVATQTDILEWPSNQGDVVTGQSVSNRLGPVVTRSNPSTSGCPIETQVSPREERRPPASRISRLAPVISRPARTGPRSVAVKTSPSVIEPTPPARIQATPDLGPSLTAVVLSSTTTVQATVTPEPSSKPGKSKSAKRRESRHNVLRQLANQPDTVDLSRLNKMQRHMITKQGRKLIDTVLGGLGFGGNWPLP